jgi:signal transduction histidine kinase
MSEEKIKILYIDDDQGNLRVFKAAFRKDYDIFLSSSTEEGLKILGETEIHVVIADQRMPGMTGVEFFEKILQLYPDPIRILLTGYSDIESVIAAINKGQIYRYISKPWNESELRIAIENAYQMYDVRKQLETTNRELKKRNDELNRFVYSASHELKAPLMTIAGILKMASENKSIDPSQYFLMIEKCTKNLEIFIRSIVDYYRNQKYEEYLKEIDFDHMIKEVIESYMFYENIGEINFNIHINQPGAFINDEFRVRVIINNLLSNCIKYQKKDNSNKFINIEIESNEMEVSIHFEDNGIGIPEKYLQSIFNMFFRATDSGNGSGIGLYIVKEAIDKIKGQIDVFSEEGKGSKFSIRIPNRIKEFIKQSV